MQAICWEDNTVTIGAGDWTRTLDIVRVEQWDAIVLVVRDQETGETFKVRK